MKFRNALRASVALGVLSAAIPLAAQPFAPATPASPASPQASAPPARVLSRSGFLGVGIQEITPERAKTLKLSDTSGVEITRVRPDSPAAKSGLMSGDVILQFNGAKVEEMEQISRLVRDTTPGKDVRIDIVRNGTPLSVTVRIGANPGVQLFSRDGLVPNAADAPRVFQGWRSPMLGIEVEALEGQLAQYFGVKQGVLVRSVMQHSPAEKAAIKAGDVILGVDDTPVTTPSEVSSKLRTLAGKTFSVSIMREHKEMPTSVTLEAVPALGTR
jgi:serine protease Do